MQVPNPHGSGAQVSEGGKGIARYSDPEQPSSPLNVRAPTSPSSESSDRQGLGGKGLFTGKGNGQAFGGNTVPFGPVGTFAQGSVPFGGPSVPGFQGQAFGPTAQCGNGGCGSCGNSFVGQPGTVGSVGMTQGNTVPVNPSFPRTDFYNKTDGSQSFLQQNSF